MNAFGNSENGILSDTYIRRAIETGLIQIDPFNEEHLNPASYDLTLGDEVAVYTHWVAWHENFDETVRGPRDGRDLYPIERFYDVQGEPKIQTFRIDPKRGWVLKPGIGYLMHTRERVHTNAFVPVLDGKSSIGRLFMKVHETAGYGDPGFNGQFTLEVTVQHSLKVYPGMRICQLRFHTISGQVGQTYDKVGHYTREAAQGAVASQAWRQFRRESAE